MYFVKVLRVPGIATHGLWLCDRIVTLVPSTRNEASETADVARVPGQPIYRLSVVKGNTECFAKLTKHFSEPPKADPVDIDTKRLSVDEILLWLGIFAISIFDSRPAKLAVFVPYLSTVLPISRIPLAATISPVFVIYPW